MMRIIELYINENDEESGVEALSLVENPATHYKWEIFEDESQCDGDCKIRQEFADSGEDLGWLLENSAGFEISDVTKEEFYTISSTPKEISPSMDGNGQIVRFYYAVGVGLGSTLIKESRKLCREFIRKDLVYRNEDLTRISAELTTDGNSYRLVPRTRNTTVDLKIYKSGKYCRHLFKKIVFNVPEGITPSEFAAKIPKRAKRTINSATLGTRPTIELQTGRGGLTEYEIYMSKDYTGAIDLLEGLVVYNSIDALFEGEPAAEAICLIEYDGKKGFIGGIPENDNYFNADVKVLNSVKIENFESYDDYPQYVSDNAARGIRLNEEVGNKCATQTGKIRAQQLANREPISEETIVRMYSYLSRAEEYYDPNDTEACGTISVLLWGGLEAKDWCERKLKQIRGEMKERFGCVQNLLDAGYGEDEARLKCYRKQYPDTQGQPDNVLPLSEEKEFITPNPCWPGYEAIGTKIVDGREVPNCVKVETSQNFSDELNYEVTTVVMEPNRYIVRRNEMGELYYVFFSEDTVKQMARKFFKQNRNKSFNYEHSGLKLNGGYVYESWIVDDPENDKSNKMGFKVNKGTWMATIKWDNKKVFDEYILNNKTTGISLEGSFLSRPGNLNSIGMEQVGEIDGLPLFDNEEEARKYGVEKYGCQGVHKHGENFMPCEAHDILMNSINSLYNNDDEVFIDEVRYIINQLNNQEDAK